MFRVGGPPSWRSARVGGPPNELEVVKLKNMKNMKKYKNENLQKHIILVNLGLREYQNRIQHVHKSAHAKYELCSCQERRVMTSLRQNRYLRIQGRMQIFRFFIVFRVFECLIGNLF